MTDDTCTLKKLIILDDEPAMVSSIIRKFKSEDCGYELKGFTSAQKALNELVKGDCSAFITDLVMPDVSGDNIVEYIHEMNPKQACIVITGSPSHDCIRRIARVGNTVDVLVKPIEFARMLTALDSIEAVALGSDQDL